MFVCFVLLVFLERAIQIERDETNSFLLSLLLFVWPGPKNAPRARISRLSGMSTDALARANGGGSPANDGRTDTRGRRRDYFWLFSLLFLFMTIDLIDCF